MQGKTEHMSANLYADSRLGGNYHLVWSAIIAGAIASLAYDALLNLLGIGIGLSSFGMNTASLLKMGTTAVIWLTLSSVISMGIGGWLTGKFCHANCKFIRAYHGVLAWALATMLAMLIAVSGTGALLGGVVSISANSAAAITSTSKLESSNVYSQTNQNLVGDNQLSDADEKLRDSSNRLGTASLVLFIAFLLSAIASAFGAVCGGVSNHKNGLD